MGSSPTRRWDLIDGVFASLIALAGLGISISLRNTTSLGGAIDSDFQKTLAALAVVFLLLVLIKAGRRYHGNVGGNWWRLEDWKRSRRR
jgi:hypothetical protein